MWKSKTIKLALVSLVILTMLLAGGCFNKPPVITSLTPGATEVARGGSCTVSCVATDENTNDTLTYAWSASGGAVSGTGSTITWTAPDSEGSYTVTVTVSDGKESVSDSCNITVVNTPPVITSLTPSATDLPPEGSANISCVASDADGDSLTYSWSATGGTVVGTGNSVSWEAPVAEGAYTINVEVSDGHGGTTSGSCGITVEMKFGSIDIQSDPAGAAVFLDGVDTGNITPYVITNLAPGTYEVMLDYYHYKNREATVTVNPDETTYINWPLTYASELSISIQPDSDSAKDVMVFAYQPDENYGTGPQLKVGHWTSVDPRYTRSYLQFDLSSLPENAVIVNAQLALWSSLTVNTVDTPAGVYIVEENWTEDGVTWNDQPDFATMPESVTDVPTSGIGFWVYWTTTNMVKGWWDGSITNYGLVLKDINEETEESQIGFYSSDWGTAAERPRLIITYFDPTS
jgi:hypothetical protein